MIHYDILSINTYDRSNWRLWALVHWMNALYKHKTPQIQHRIRGNIYMSAINIGLRPEFAQELAQL